MGRKEDSHASQADDSENPEQLLRLKDDILPRFGQLPQEHQAKMGLVLVKTITEGEWGEWFKSAIARQYLNTTLFPLVARHDLESADFTAEEIAQLSDDDIATITRKVEEHMITDLFWDELRFHTQAVLKEKQPNNPPEGSTTHD